MKKGQWILLSVCAMSLCLVLGIFLGRNLPGNYIQPVQHTQESEAALPDESEETVAVTQTTDGLLDLNTATQTQLMELPGIGEVLAQRIIAYRQTQGPFAAVEDLLNVNGIGEKKLEQMEPFIKVGG